MASPEAGLMKALKSRYPHLTQHQREKVAALMLKEIAAAIERGDRIGAVFPTPGGGQRVEVFDEFPLPPA